MAAGNDERPPIIVRGGSLVIQSGDEKSSNPKHITGKPWKNDSNDKKRWKQKHDNGKHVGMYSVTFVGGGAGCSATHSPEVRVTYELTNGENVVVLIGRDKTSDPDDLQPLVTSSRELTVDNDKDQPTLTLPLDGKIVSISAGSVHCSSPVKAILQPVGGKDSDDRPSAAKILLTMAAIVGVAMALAFFLGAFDRNGDEERPPIIVRGGSIVFENQPFGSTGQSKLWVPSGTQKWKPDHRDGQRITGFRVTVPGTSCALNGNPVKISRTIGSATQEYDIKKEGFFRVDPKVEAPQGVEMEVNNSIPKTTLSSRDTGGTITQVRIGGNSCPVSAGQEIHVQPLK